MCGEISISWAWARICSGSSAASTNTCCPNRRCQALRQQPSRRVMGSAKTRKPPRSNGQLAQQPSARRWKPNGPRRKPGWGDRVRHAPIRGRSEAHTQRSKPRLSRRQLIETGEAGSRRAGPATAFALLVRVKTGVCSIEPVRDIAPNSLPVRELVRNKPALWRVLNIQFDIVSWIQTYVKPNVVYDGILRSIRTMSMSNLDWTDTAQDGSYIGTSHAGDNVLTYVFIQSIVSGLHTNSTCCTWYAD